MGLCMYNVVHVECGSLTDLKMQLFNYTCCVDRWLLEQNTRVRAVGGADNSKHHPCSLVTSWRDLWGKLYSKHVSSPGGSKDQQKWIGNSQNRERKMRCYLHAFLLCVLFTLCSLLYVFNQLASTLEDGDEWSLREQGAPDRSGRDTGRLLRKNPGLTGLRDGEAGLYR